jgi:hypothetical protein
MRNVTIERPRLVGRERSTGRKAGIAVGAVAIAIAAIVAANLAVYTDEPVTLSAAQQVEADRLTGLAEFESFASIRQARAAEAARWQAMGESYQLSRARQTEIDRLNGLAAYFGLAGVCCRFPAQRCRRRA